MANVRKTGNRHEFDALWAQVNKLVADVTEIRTRLVALGNDFGTGVGPIIGGIVEDVSSLYTSVTALTAKLDADAQITAADWASTCDPEEQSEDGDFTPTYAAPAALTSSTTTLVAPW